MTTLAVLHPIDPGTGARVTVRVCSSQERDATGAGGERWIPAMVVQPALTMALFDGDFTSAVSPAQSRIVLRLEALKEVGGFDRAARFDWSGAAVTLYRLEGSLPVLLAEMRVRSFGSEAGALSLDLSVDSEWADAEVLFRRYAGTTGAEGIADLKDRLKPWAFGRCRNVEPVQIDLINNVFQVSGYGPVSAISAVYERGASFGASLGDFPNYAALVAADIPEGRWGTCLAEGMFRLGAPPAGVITCDVDGDSTSGFLRRTGAIISEIARRLGLETRVNAASLAALDVAVPRNVNILITEQTTLIDLAQAMAAPCNAVAALALDSRLVMPRIAFGAAKFVLDAQGRQMPPVLGMARQNSSPPYSEIRMGAARSWRVHTFDEIAFFADLIDRGLYDAATTYREGNIVESADKSRWVYVNPAASSGNAPPTWPTASNSFWSNIAPPLGGDLIGSIVAPANANRVPFSRMEGDRGWIAATNSPGGPTPGYFEFEGRRAISANATATAAGQVITLAAGPGNQGVFPVVPGERLSVSARIGDATNTSGLQINFGYTRANGTYNEITVVAVGAQGWLAAPVAGFVDVPSDARLGTIRLYAFAAGAGFYNATISEPMVTSAAAGQTVHPPFSPGPNASDGADPNSLITVDGSGVLSGIGTVGIPVDNRNVPLGNANRVPFSRFEGGQGWFTVGDFNPPTFLIVSNARYFICAEPTFTAANQNVFLANTPRMPVLAGETLSISAAVQAFALPGGLNPNYWHLYWEYYSSLNAGTQIGITTIGQGFTGISEGVRHAAFSTVPAGAQAAQLVLRYESAGAGQVRLAILEPMVTSAAPGQAVHPPYTPGPNSVDGATRNTGALNADGLDSIDAGGPLFVGLLPPSKAEAGLINANVALGSNAVVNSDFTRGKFGWRWGGGGFEDQWGTNLPGWFGQRNVMWARVSGAFASGSYRDLSPDALWTGGTLANAPLFALAVNDADRLFAGVLAASHRCAFQLWILVFDGAGTLIQAEEAIGGLPDGAANGDPANFSRITRFSDVPTGGRWAIPMMRMLGNGGIDPFIFFTEPMLAKVPSGQTGIPRYTPGRADSRGQPNSDILISGGVISGIGTANIFVDNARAVLQSLASARPASGQYLNQVHFATDTLVASQWDGFNWRSSADITFAVSGPAEVKLSYRSNLTLISTLPVTATYQLAPAGASALTSGVTWAVSVVSGTFSGTAPSIIGSGSGQLRINSELTSAEAQLRVTATVAGRNYPPFNVTVRREIAAPTSAPLTSFSTSSFTQAHAATIQVAIPSGVTSAALSAVAELQIAGAAPSGVTTCEGKWQRQSSPGTWVDIGAVATSSPSPEVVETEFTPGEIIYVPSSGSITCNRTATGLTGGTTQNFRFVARVSAGNVRNVQMIGNASAQA